MFRLSYVGPPSRVGTLAAMLRSAGLDVRYVPPRQSPRAFEIMTAVALFVQGGPSPAADDEPAVTDVMEQFRDRFPDVTVVASHWAGGAGR
jgi:hypothetical protein